MAYGVKYRIQFSSIGSQQNYSFDILQKDYFGEPMNLLAGAVPVKHKWDLDDPISPIKGSNVTVNYINEGTTPYTIFYNLDDTTFKGQLFWETQKMFEGFLVLDDSNENVDDVGHTVSLSFNDGLGILKDITLDKAYKPGLNELQTTTDNILTYTIITQIFKHCIYCTGLGLEGYIFEQIFENAQTGPFPDSTSINLEMFLTGSDEWDNCYSVLTKILNHYKLTLLQAQGKWQLIRWPELRYNAGVILGYTLDTGFNITGAPARLDDKILVKTPTIPPVPTDMNFENGLLQRTLIQLKFVKETFNYRQPANFKNADFTILGVLLRTYTTGAGTSLKRITEYDAPYWTKYISVTQQVFIRIEKDYLNNEVERYIVVKGPSFDDIRSVVSSSIEISALDFVKVSFQCRTVDITNSIFALTVRNTSPVNLTYFAKGVQNPAASTVSNGWQITRGWTYQSTPSNTWFDVEIDANKGVPIDGILELYLGNENNNTANETHYKSITLDYTFKVNESLNIIGHIHQEEQTPANRRNIDEEIFIDDSPKNAIAGTTFNFGQDIGLLHKRTQFWHRNSLPEALRLGNIIVFEQEFWRRKPRTILEGTINGLYDVINGHTSIITLVRCEAYPGLNFIFGRCEIDYRNDSVNGTLYEMYDDGETDGDMIADYAFTYIYKTN